MTELSPDQVEQLARLAERMDRREQTGDWLSDTHFEAIVDRPWVLLALIALVPKRGDKWTEPGLLLWLEIVEKSARMVYGLRHDWMDNLCPDPEAHLGPEERRDAEQAPAGPKPEPQVEPSVDLVADAPGEPAVEPDEPDEDSEDPGSTLGEPEGDEADDESNGLGSWGRRHMKPYQGPVKPRVLEAMAPGETYSTEDIYELIGQKSGVGAALGWMVRKGEIELEDGRYRLPGETAAERNGHRVDATSEPDGPTPVERARVRSPRPGLQAVNPARALDLEASVRRRAAGSS